MSLRDLYFTNSSNSNRRITMQCSSKLNNSYSNRHSCSSSSTLHSNKPISSHSMATLMRTMGYRLNLNLSSSSDRAKVNSQDRCRDRYKDKDRHKGKRRDKGRVVIYSTAPTSSPSLFLSASKYSTRLYRLHTAPAHYMYLCTRLSSMYVLVYPLKSYVQTKCSLVFFFLTLFYFPLAPFH